MKWPRGVRSAAISAGIKSKGELDLGVLVADRPCTWAGAFTRNSAAAAPVEWSKARLSRSARAIIVNSGNANACTGAAGMTAVEQEAQAVADALSCDPDEVLVAATGPIGELLPVDRIVSAVPAVTRSLGIDVDPFARSILTTDTKTKVADARAGAATVVGVAKGAAMLAPNMATMLAFLATDASVDEGTLQKILEVAVERSFNRISVDACESTNDSVFMLATGAAGDCDVDALVEATTEVCKSLAYEMVADAEGGSKVIRIEVTGAQSERAACELARAVASSALWRAAVYGRDPNWGRVVAALGGADASLRLDDVTVSLGDVTVFRAGEPLADKSAALAVMSQDEVSVVCSVGSGPGTAEFLTSDLTPDYVTLNATGTT